VHEHKLAAQWEPQSLGPIYWLPLRWITFVACRRRMWQNICRQDPQVESGQPRYSGLLTFCPGNWQTSGRSEICVPSHAHQAVGMQGYDGLAGVRLLQQREGALLHQLLHLGHVLRSRQRLECLQHLGISTSLPFPASSYACTSTQKSVEDGCSLGCFPSFDDTSEHLSACEFVGSHL